MPRLSGSLKAVTGDASSIRQVSIRSLYTRPQGGGAITNEVTVLPVSNGQFTTEVLPGPAVLLLISRSGNVSSSDGINLFIPSEDVDLEKAMVLAEGMNNSTKSALDQLKKETADKLLEALASGEKLQGDITATANNAKSTIEKAVTAGNKSIDTKVSTANKTIDGKVSTATGDIDKKVTAATGDINKKVETATSSIDSKVSTATGDIDKKVTDATNTINTDVDTARNAIDGLVSDAGTSIKEQSDSASQSLTEVATAANKSIDDKVTSAGTDIDGKISAAEGRLKTTADTATKEVNAAANVATSTITGAKDDAEKTISDGVSAAKAEFGKVSEASATGVQAIKDQEKASAANIETKGTGYVNDAKQSAEDAASSQKAAATSATEAGEAAELAKSFAGGGATQVYVDQGLAKKADVKHTHAIADVTGLQDELNAKALKSDIPAPQDISGLATKKEVTDGLAGKSDKAHTHVKADISDLEEVTESATGRAIVKRRIDGNITVPESPVYLGDAASKRYVDSELNEKADIRHSHSKADLYNLEEITESATAGTIVKRGTNGNITVPQSPASGTDAASKSYVDTKISEAASQGTRFCKLEITGDSSASTGNFYTLKTKLDSSKIVDGGKMYTNAFGFSGSSGIYRVTFSSNETREIGIASLIMFTSGQWWKKLYSTYHSKNERASEVSMIVDAATIEYVQFLSNGKVSGYMGTAYIEKLD